MPMKPGPKPKPKIARRVELRRDTPYYPNKNTKGERVTLRKDTNTNQHKNSAKGRISVFGEAKLTRREINFCMEYTKDFNIAQAALRAGYSQYAAHSCATLMHKPAVLNFIQHEMEKRAKRIQVDADLIAKQWYDLANADPRELFPFGACRFCHGIDHQYQMTMNEHRSARQHHMQVMLLTPHDKRVPFDEKGGAGYNALEAPHPECPECHGVGIPRILDLSKLSKAGVYLFDGIKIHKDGTMEIKMRSRDRALENFQLLMGFVQTRRKIEEFDPARMSDDQLDAALQTALDKGMLTLNDDTSSLNALVTVTDYQDITMPATEEAEA